MVVIEYLLHYFGILMLIVLVGGPFVVSIAIALYIFSSLQKRAQQKNTAFWLAARAGWFAGMLVFIALLVYLAVQIVTSEGEGYLGIVTIPFTLVPIALGVFIVVWAAAIFVYQGKRPITKNKTLTLTAAAILLLITAIFIAHALYIKTLAFGASEKKAQTEESVRMLYDNRFARNNDTVLAAIASNPNTPADILVLISESRPGAQVVSKILLHNNTPSELIREYYEAGRNLPHVFAANPSTPPDILEEIGAKNTVNNTVSLRNDAIVGKNLAQNPSSPPALLEKLLREHPSQEVRLLVVQNPNTPLSVLKNFIDDEDAAVKKAIEERLSLNTQTGTQ